MIAPATATFTEALEEWEMDPLSLQLEYKRPLRPQDPLHLALLSFDEPFPTIRFNGSGLGVNRRG